MSKHSFKGSYTSFIITYFFFYFSMSIFSSILSVYLTGIGKSPSEMSFIISASSVFSLFCVPFVGYLNDKFQRPRNIATFILIFVGLLALLFSLTESVWVLFLLNGLIMAGVGALSPITEKIAGSSKFRYGRIRVWGTLGYAVGAQIAGISIQYISPSFIFVFFFISSLITMIGFWGLDDPKLDDSSTDSEDVAKSESKSSMKEIGAFLKNPKFLLYLIIVFLFWGASFLNMTYVPVLLTDIGLKGFELGTVLFFSTLIEIPLIVFSHKYMDKLSVRMLMVLSFILAMLQFGIYAVSTSQVVTVLTVVLLKALSSTLFMMINLKTVRILVSSKYTTTALAVVSAVNSLGAILLQNLGGLLVEATDIPTLYIALTGVSAFALILSLFLKTDNSEKVFDVK